MTNITIRSGNVELTVPADQKDRYMKLGYSVIDEQTGEVLEEAPSQDVATLQAEVAKLKAENAKLKAEISKLSSKSTSSRREKVAN